MNAGALNIETAPVDSSQIAEIGYDATTQTLAVRFKSGGLYHYSGVEKELYDDMRAAKSLGAFFFKSIKAGGFAYKRFMDAMKTRIMGSNDRTVGPDAGLSRQVPHE
jgi:hypothetical protein